MIQRQAEGVLSRLLEGPKVVILLGARQVGKTTLAEMVTTGRRTRFLNFDLLSDQQRMQVAAAMPPTDALRFLGSPEILVLDEAQRLPEVSRIVKGWHDARLPVKILLLGSSALNLLGQATEALTGRNRKLMLPPLTFQETLQTQPWYSPEVPAEILVQKAAGALRAWLLERLAMGSYPEVVTSSQREALLQELASDYLWKDIFQESLLKNPAAIRRLLQMIAHQIGGEVSVQELAGSLGMTRATVERYLDLLEATGVIFRLPAFSTNPRKEISKSKKIYFWDTGIRNAVCGGQFQADELRPDIGALWENWVIAEAAKRNLLSGSPGELFFWRTYDQSEVDLVLRCRGVLHPFEIKWRDRRKAGKSFQNHYGRPVEFLTAQDPLLTSLPDFGSFSE